ncbi:molybdopterin-dependent oxidoreductase [Aquipuribacter sp. SD81]|uniref:molybdopterin-dependent oxidoreductase n=1 Tax=Aquipuribacter sp. SD81 TaxID=3127703 RepID=UPI00301B5964
MTTSSSRPRRGAHPRVRGAVAGLGAAALLLGTAHLVAAVVGRGSDPFLAVGDAVVRLSPPALTSAAIETFGSYDKVVLLAGVAVVLVAVAAASGAVAVSRLAVGAAVPVLLVLAALVAVLSAPGAGPLDVLPTVAGTLVAVPVFVLLVRAARAARAPSDDADVPAPAVSRRRFVGLAGAVAAVAAGLAGAGTAVASAVRDAVASREGLRLPAAAEPVGEVPAGARLVDTVPFRTPVDELYRVDTALTVPQVRAEDWRLRVHGLVDRPLELDWDSLTRTYEVVEREITLVCVSNPVGGELAGNVVWTGVRLADVLADAGVDPTADMLLSTSVDGWSASTPLEALLGDEDALLAFGIDRRPLPFEHGFPVRMVVPGLYGYVSATKWVVDLEVTRFADDEAYWTPRGYAAEAPVKTASRIDVPASFAQLEAGPVVVAGTAWHPALGIDRVEVRVDGGEWAEAELGDVPSVLTWRQWRWEWDASPGQHRLEVRATDAAGDTQTDERAEVAPDGATGWHSVAVTVT